MKQVIIFVAIVGMSFCAGAQIIDTSWRTGRSLLPITAVVKPDTVKVVMLVCDTSFKPNPRGHVWWSPGYRILGGNYYYYDGGWNLPPSVFLDRHKQPLDKKYIVWMVKEIK